MFFTKSNTKVLASSCWECDLIWKLDQRRSNELLNEIDASLSVTGFIFRDGSEHRYVQEDAT